MIDANTLALIAAMSENATVTEDSIIDALGYTPAVDMGNFQLIETISLDTETRSVARTIRADTGSQYHLAAAIIVVTGKSAYSNSSIYWYSPNNTLVALGRLTTNTAYSTVLRGAMVGGFMWAEGCNDASLNSAMIESSAGAKDQTCYPKGYIDGFTISCSSDMLAGTTIKIYGLESSLPVYSE